MAYTHKLKLRTASGNYDGDISYDDFKIEGEFEQSILYSLSKKLSIVMEFFRKIHDEFGFIDKIEIKKVGSE